MKPELNLTAGSAWADPEAVHAAPDRRFWAILSAVVIAACMVLALTSGRLRAYTSSPYTVSVPVTFKPNDPALWAVLTAENYEAALQLDPTLPDPRSIGFADATATPAVDPAQLRLEAFVGPAAKSFAFRGVTALDRERAHYCLTAAIYYEAASETDDGMRGVAQTVLNRVRHPSFPNTVCGVVFQGSQRAGVCQFTFSCDGAMARAPSRPNWLRASRIAAAALAGQVFPAVGLATHYHTQAIWPRWGKSLVMTNIVGAHIFHRWRGRWGELSAFRAPYEGREPVPGPYMPIAQQLAVLQRGGAASVLLPGGAVSSPLIAPTTAIAPTPGAMAQSARDTGSQESRAATGPATQVYTDPRLNQSGLVRDEFRRSGEWIR